MSPLSRRSFIASSAILGCSAAAKSAHPSRVFSRHAPDSSFPHQDPAVVQAVVGAAHANFDKVKELVEKCPPLARASWDWGFGDWESALGAASHMGRRDIAEFLIAHSARPDIFTFAMFGRLDAVKAMITAQPGIQRIPGPHGITLLQHAKNGGADSAAVAKYLEELGDAGTTVEDLGITPAEVPTYIGSYRVVGDADVTFVIKEVKGRLAFQRAEESHRFLSRRGEHEFTPVGTPEVRLSFQVRDGRAVSIQGSRHVNDFAAVRIG